MEAIDGLVKLFERAEREGCTSYGLWHERGSLSYADVMAGPCESILPGLLSPLHREVCLRRQLALWLARRAAW